MPFKLIFIITLLVSAVFFTMNDYISKGPIPTCNMLNKEILPKNFRSTSDFKEKKELNLEGFSKLNMSGSGQFSESSLKKLLETLPKNDLFIIDLREESHAFVNGIAFNWRDKKNWINHGKTLDEINQDEQYRLSKIKLNQPYTLRYKAKYQLSPFSVKVISLHTEEELVKGLAVQYKRFPVSDYCKPSDEIVDHFIQFIKTIPQGAWLHFHCAAGKGRTSTFMIMHDMMENAHKVGYEDILQRQGLLGGLNFLNPSLEIDWRTIYHEERRQFVQQFYKYCQENIPSQFAESWSSWIKDKRQV